MLVPPRLFAPLPTLALLVERRTGLGGGTTTQHLSTPRGLWLVSRSASNRNVTNRRGFFMRVRAHEEIDLLANR